MNRRTLLRLALGSGMIWAERSFDPASDAPVSSHDISGLAGVAYALSM